MTYAAQEISQESGKPVDLYEFRLDLQVYRYTSAEDDQVVGGQTYTAIPISRGAVTQGQESRNAALTITLPANNPLASRYVTTVPSERAEVTISQFHRGDGNLITVFVGRVKSVAFGDSGQGYKAKIAVDPPISAGAQQIPRFTFRGQCNNVLGDAISGDGLCDVDLEDSAYKLSAICSAQSGRTITVPGAAAFGDGWFTAGRATTLAGLDARMIVDHTGDVLTLHINFPFPVVGETLILRAGCAHDIETCSTKFGKVGVFQGFAYVPKINIFESGLGSETC